MVVNHSLKLMLIALVNEENQKANDEKQAPVDLNDLKKICASHTITAFYLWKVTMKVDLKGRDTL